MSKTCRKCGIAKDLTEFYIHEKMADGHLNFCKDCVKDRVRDHRANNDHVRTAERFRYHHGRKKGQVKQWQDENEKRMHIAKWACGVVRAAIKKGLIVKPSQCERCEAEGFVESSHHDYTKPLEVEWLCRRCHRRDDARRPKTITQIEDLHLERVELRRKLEAAEQTISLLLRLLRQQQGLDEVA